MLLVSCSFTVSLDIVVCLLIVSSDCVQLVCDTDSVMVSYLSRSRVPRVVTFLCHLAHSFWIKCRMAKTCCVKRVGLLEKWLSVSEQLAKFGTVQKTSHWHGVLFFLNETNFYFRTWGTRKSFSVFDRNLPQDACKHILERNLSLQRTLLCRTLRPPDNMNVSRYLGLSQ